MTRDPTPRLPIHRLGFSLIELVIVVVIIGIIGAVAVPRMSRGSEGAAVSALVNDLALLNKALDLYAAEHHGEFPDPARIATQLTTRTDASGDAWATGVAYGPYLRAIPALPVGDKKGNAGIAAADGAGVGWLYAQARGVIRPNLTRDDGAVNETLVTKMINGSTLKRDDLVVP